MMKLTLKAARVNAGLTQKEAAKLIGVSNKTLGNWENGISYPKADKVEKICSVYGLSYDNIIFLPQHSLLANIESGQPQAE